MRKFRRCTSKPSINGYRYRHIIAKKDLRKNNNKCMKPFKTYEEQLNILRNRNLIINDIKYAMRKLRNIGYYNLINGYSDVFLDKKYQDVYRKNIKFEDIVNLFEFDADLREILYKYLLICEQRLTAIIPYELVKGESAYDDFWDYLDFQRYCDYDETEKENLIREKVKALEQSKFMTEKLQDFAEKSDPVRHYLEKNDGIPPIWVLFLSMTFGNKIHFFKKLTNKQKKSIILSIRNDLCCDYECEFNEFDSGIFLISAQVMNDLRNCVAHNERTFSKKIKIKKYYVSNGKKTNKKIKSIKNLLSRIFREKVDFKNKVNLNDALKIMSLLMEREYHEKLINEIKKLLTDYKVKFDNKTYIEIKKSMGIN